MGDGNKNKAITSLGENTPISILGNKGVLSNRNDDWTIYATVALQAAKALKQDPANKELVRRYQQALSSVAQKGNPDYASQVAFLAKGASDSNNFDDYIKSKVTTATRSTPAMGGINSLYNLLSGNKGIYWVDAALPTKTDVAVR